MARINPNTLCTNCGPRTVWEKSKEESGRIQQGCYRCERCGLAIYSSTHVFWADYFQVKARLEMILGRPLVAPEDRFDAEKPKSKK